MAPDRMMIDRRRLARLAAGVALLPAMRAAWAAEDIVVGQVAPFSGPQAVTGRAIHAGAKLYFDAVNARGGVRGRGVRLVTRDDGQRPEDTVRLARELVAAERPLAMIGTVGTSNLEALAKDGFLAAQRITTIGAVSGARSVLEAPGMHAVKATYRDEVGRLFRQLAQLGMRRVGLVYQDDALGRDVLAGAEEAAARHGIELAARGAYARNTVAVEQAVSAMASAKVQVVFLGATTAAGIEFVKQYTAAGGNGLLYGMSIIDTDALLKALGPERSRGYAFTVVLPLAHRTDLAVVREYLQLARAARDPDLSARSIEGFIAAKALVMVLQGAASLTPESVTAAFALARDVDVGGFRLDFGSKGQASSSYVDFALVGSGGRILQ